MENERITLSDDETSVYFFKIGEDITQEQAHQIKDTLSEIIDGDVVVTCEDVEPMDGREFVQMMSNLVRSIIHP